MLRAPKARAEIFPPPHLLDRGYAPAVYIKRLDVDLMYFESFLYTHCFSFAMPSHFPARHQIIGIRKP